MALALLSACSSGVADTSGTRTSSRPGASTPVATETAWGRISRPLCAEPDEGTFLHQESSPGTVTPVLVLGDGARGVVLGAQANGGICQVMPFGRELADRGYHVALFEWRDPYPDSMAAATTALADAGAQRIVVGGFSRGALVGLGVAPRLGPKVVGAFSVSGGPSESEGFPTVRSLARFRGPVLLVDSEDDATFPPGTVRRIAARHKGPEQVLVLPGSDHALRLLEGEHSGRVRAAIFDFLDRATG